MSRTCELNRAVRLPSWAQEVVGRPPSRVRGNLCAACWLLQAGVPNQSSGLAARQPSFPASGYAVRSGRVTSSLPEGPIWPWMVLPCRPSPRWRPGGSRAPAAGFISRALLLQAQLALKCGCTCNMPPHRERTPALG